jgi:CMP-N-acetylneuraminic acid synthetase
MPRVLGIIPARGGSKGVPRKNLRLLGGIPLIAHTIRAAHGSALLTRVIVSTDDDEIARTASDRGAEVPFRRPLVLAGDDTSQALVAVHAVEWCEEEEGEAFDIVVLLQPTSPFRRPEDIDATISLLRERPSASTAISVVPAGTSHPNYMYEATSTPRLVRSLAPHVLGFQRQSFDEVFVRNGAVYAVRRSHLIVEQSLMAPETLAHVMSPRDSLNIDTEFDLLMAESLLGLAQRDPGT